MQIIDKKFAKNKVRYILQCLLATVVIFIILLILDAISNAAIIVALGASSFIAFTMPTTEASKPRYMLGGYLVGIAAGGLCYYLSLLPIITNSSFLHEFSYVIFGAIAVGLTMFVMVITNTEHPPAASLALGLVLNDCTLKVIIVVLTGIISLIIIKWLLKPFLKNLL